MVGRLASIFFPFLFLKSNSFAIISCVKLLNCAFAFFFKCNIAHSMVRTTQANFSSLKVASQSCLNSTSSNWTASARCRTHAKGALNRTVNVKTNKHTNKQQQKNGSLHLCILQRAAAEGWGRVAPQRWQQQEVVLLQRQEKSYRFFTRCYCFSFTTFLLQSLTTGGPSITYHSQTIRHLVQHHVQDAAHDVLFCL